MRQRSGKWQMTVVLGGLILALGAGHVVAQRSDFARNMRGLGQWWNSPEMVDRLGLDDATREEIDDQVYDTQHEMIGLRSTLQSHQLELQRVLVKSTDDFDLGDVEKLVDRLVSAQGAVTKSEIMLRARIMAMLSSDQRHVLQQAHSDQRQDRRRNTRDRRTDSPRDRPEDP